MDQWIQVFRTGKHTDSAGKEKEWTEEDLDRIVAKYDPLVSEAPVVIGHPTENAPAFGWVEGLRREGRILYAKLKDLVPEFMDMVRRGLFKKRSISLRPDLSLRHIGFLGAMPPAIKGLQDIRFQEGNEITINFSDIEGLKNSQEGETRMSNSKDAGKKIVEFVEEKMREDKALTYSEALVKVQLENPDLIREYLSPGQIKVRVAHRRATDILKNPHRAGTHAEKNPKNISYSQALEIVLQEDPELAQAYADGIDSNGGITVQREKAQAAINKIMSLAEKEIEEDGTLSYSEALRKVHKKNPELVREYQN